ncbi:MAG TPA: glycosyltransferase, partial [Candidatus Woesebacteria bacterium]|nr:glycosyltransferase [Candidatus Woesebacteria bacterium]
MKNLPRIALVHDYLKEYGGAESVLETLSDLFPQAEIYTSVYHPASFGPHRSRLEKKWSHRIHQSFFKYLPFAHKLISPLRFLSPLAFRSFDFSSYDLIIVSATGAFFPNAVNKRQAKLITYCHTPPRYLYGLVTARSLDTWFFKLVNIPLQFILHFYRLFDFKFAQNVDQFIANSQTTAGRIQKFYRRDSIIINPPI